MGGIDKGLVELDGRPLIEHVLERLRPQVGHLLINANRNPSRYAAYGYPVIADRLEGYQGPLAGFAALLKASPDPWLVITPCDSPRLPPDYVQRFVDARQRSGADILVAHDGQRIQPVHVMLRQDLLPDLEDFLANGERKIDHWYARCHTAEADFGDCADCFINLNRPEDYALLESAR